MLGVTFKPDVRDTRNCRVLDLVQELKAHGIEVVVHDPLVESTQLQKLGLTPLRDPFQFHQPGQPDKPDKPQYDAVILAVPHASYREEGLEAYLALLKGVDKPGVLVDVKGVLLREAVKRVGVLYWSL